MNRLWVRLTLAFALVTLIGLVFAAVLANSQVSIQFRLFVARDQMMNSPLVGQLAEYYARQGNWLGVETVLDSLHGPGGMGMGGQGMGGMMRRGMPGLLLADARGQVLYDRREERVGTLLSRQERDEAVPIVVAGRAAGYLLSGVPGRDELTGPAQAFLAQLNWALIQAGLIAGGLGLLLGLAIARGLSAPLGRLATAARSISRGELDQQVPVRGTDEVADLARAFNEMAAALHQAETLRRNMVADIAHELRTPLTVIQGNLQAILDDVYPLDKTEIATIYDETLMLSRLVGDLRALAQAEAGQLSLNPQPVELQPLLESALAPFEGLAQERQARLEVILPPGLPPVLVDVDRIRQVIVNLLNNALRYTPTGEKIAVAVDRPGTDGLIRVSVQDCGPGIAAQDLPHVFDRFWRADRSRSRDQGGTGLGLAIARQLVEAHGGQIGVESPGVPGQGSCFWFTLPVADRAK